METATPRPPQARTETPLRKPNRVKQTTSYARWHERCGTSMLGLPTAACRAKQHSKCASDSARVHGPTAAARPSSSTCRWAWSPVRRVRRCARMPLRLRSTRTCHVLDGREHEAPQGVQAGLARRVGRRERTLPVRTMPGAEQERSLYQGIAATAGRWNIIASPHGACRMAAASRAGVRHPGWDGYKLGAAAWKRDAVAGDRRPRSAVRHAPSAIVCGGSTLGIACHEVKESVVRKRSSASVPWRASSPCLEQGL